MAFIDWDRSLELGHPIIDPDHQGLVVCVNQLASAISAVAADGESEVGRRQRVCDAVLALRQAAARHFQSEEWIMENAAYPTMAAHQSVHRNLLEEYDAFADDFYVPAGGNAALVLNFLRDWFLYHVQTWDDAFVRWLEDRPEH